MRTFPHQPDRSPTALLGSTTMTVEGYRVARHLGVVLGVYVRSPTILQGIFGALKSIVGGRIGSYVAMCEQTRSSAYDEMMEHARALGANAVIGIRYDASEAVKNAHEVLCYGTAVVVERAS